MSLANMGGELLAFSGSVQSIELNNERLIIVSGSVGNCNISVSRPDNKALYTHVEEAFHEAPESSIPPVLFNSTIDIGVIRKEMSIGSWRILRTQI